MVELPVAVQPVLGEASINVQKMPSDSIKVLFLEEAWQEVAMVEALAIELSIALSCPMICEETLR